MKFSSVLLGMVIGFFGYFVMLQCITASNPCIAQQISTKNAEIWLLKHRIEFLERQIGYYEKIRECQEVINRSSRGIR